MHPILERELQKLGLTEKETRVYLAALELGPQPVQDIARKAGVNRATTYVMIESLTQKGLMTSFERGKKRLFNPEHPDRLLSMIRVRERELQEQEREFSQFLPQLRAISSSSGERPRVRFFEGPEGLRAIREEILATEASEMWAAIEFKELPHVLSPAENDEFERRLAERGVRQYVLCTGTIAPDAVQKHMERYPNFSLRSVPVDRFPFTGEVTVFGNKIFAFSHRGKLIGAVIESEEIAKMLRSVFQLAWEGSQHVGATEPAKK
ncbi:hypothetical protein HYV74_04675 [Candidatus Uhrbacteria bacterium]|nr:hypothetical protein [Candidatus Uhrbacteria bacterium]